MEWTPTRAAGLAQLATFIPHAGKEYAASRNHDDGIERRNVSRLSPWLHTGLLDEAEVCNAVLGQHSLDAADRFIAEVFWRIYFKGYIKQRPTIWPAYCQERDAAFALLEANTGRRTAYIQAIEGRTGIEAFDHWASELVETGYLHNHARMWFASIWIFTLKLDWQLGADFFLRHLIDGDAASNTLSWRWVGGLHTKGKTYLARPDNIARYTERHPDGPLMASDLACEAAALEEGKEHTRQPLDLPTAATSDAFAQPYALLLHDDAASHVPLDLASAPALVIGASRPDARSPRAVGELSRRFADDAVTQGVGEAAAIFGCPELYWTTGRPLADILADKGIERIVAPYLPVGWTRDALWPELAPLAANGQLITILSDLDRKTWPQARAGFFSVKNQIESILREAGIFGAL